MYEISLEVGMIEYSVHSANSYIICTSWIKHYLYDARAKFDIFSGYESNLIFLAFLHFKGLLKVYNEDQA